VRRRFPAARVTRWDSDVTGRKGAHEQLWKSFAAGEADVLVGTQMIGKGLDFPGVSLVGIVLADQGLYRPDFRAAERTFQILTQVAGRAGRRAGAQGRVILQTYAPDHYVIRAAARHDYLDLYRREIAFRRQQAYPPFRQLIRLVHSASNPERGWNEVLHVCGSIQAHARELGLTDLQLLGPAPAPLRRLRGRYRWHVVLAGSDARRVLDEVRPGPGWVVDVDPMEIV
jgi:primosomal protein N' (replication factor Y)